MTPIEYLDKQAKQACPNAQGVKENMMRLLFAGLCALCLWSQPVPVQADTLAAELDQAVKQVAPITGVSIGDTNDKLTWKLHFKPKATQEQKDEAQAVLDAFTYDPNKKSEQELKRDAILADPTVPQSVKEWIQAEYP